MGLCVQESDINCTDITETGAIHLDYQSSYNLLALIFPYSYKFLDVTILFLKNLTPGIEIVAPEKT